MITITPWTGLFPLVSLPGLHVCMQILPVTRLQYTRTLPEWGRTVEELIQTDISHADATAFVQTLAPDAALPTEDAWRDFAIAAARIPFTSQIRMQLKQVGLSADAAIQLDHLLEISKPATLAQAMLLQHGTLEWVNRPFAPPLGIMGSPHPEFFARTGSLDAPALTALADKPDPRIGFRPMLIRRGGNSSI
ncbi:MAG: hypothetical protein ACKO3T_14155 [Planctomycetaceae bacterium]